MGQKPPRGPIYASVELRGSAEEVLSDLRRLEGCERTVSLSVAPPSRAYAMSSGDANFIPPIANGNTKPAIEKLADLSHQTLVDDETARRLEYFIREFGHLTK